MLTNSSLWLPVLVLPPPILLLLGHYFLFGQVHLLWMTRRLQDVVLKQELLLFIHDREADLGTIRVDDGFCGA